MREAPPPCQAARVRITFELPPSRLTAVICPCWPSSQSLHAPLFTNAVRSLGQSPRRVLIACLPSPSPSGDCTCVPCLCSPPQDMLAAFQSGTYSGPERPPSPAAAAPSPSPDTNPGTPAAAIGPAGEPAMPPPPLGPPNAAGAAVVTSYPQQPGQQLQQPGAGGAVTPLVSPARSSAPPPATASAMAVAAALAAHRGGGGRGTAASAVAPPPS